MAEGRGDRDTKPWRGMCTAAGSTGSVGGGPVKRLELSGELMTAGDLFWVYLLHVG